MTDETYKKMVKMARKWVTLLAPLVSIEYNKKFDGFDWIFNETTPKGSRQEVALNFKSFVMTVSSARESLLKENSDLIEREFPLSQFETMGSLLTIYLNDDRTNVWINRIARPGYDLARAPIFIVSSWRSGSTLLSSIMNSHPNIVVMPENNFLDGFVRNEYCVRGNDPILYKDIEPIVKAQARANALAITQDEFYLCFSRFIDEIFSSYARKSGKSRWILKENSNYDALDLEDLIFGYNAKFILLIRHGLDVVHSHIDRYQYFPITNLTRYAEEWVSVNQKIADFHERIEGRGFKLRYEDLISRPREKVCELLEFIGEPWDENIFSTMENSNVSLGGDYKIDGSGGKIDANRLNRWKHWPPTLVRQMSKIVNPMLEKAGYDPVSLE